MTNTINKKEKNNMTNTIKIDNVDYVRADSLNVSAPEVEGLEYKIFRTYSSGVFGGYLAEKKDSVGHFKCVVKKARRFHYWEGAASLSQLAEEGATKSKHSDCRFAMELTGDLELPNVVEIISVTAKAKANIDEIPVWRV